MPSYTFECVSENGGCGTIFETYCLIKDYPPKKLKCPNCKLTKYIQRNFSEDLPHTNVGKQTLGSIAEKNTSKLSEEAKDQLWKKHNDYRFKQPTTQLPKGWHRVSDTPSPPKPRKKRAINKR